MSDISTLSLSDLLALQNAIAVQKRAIVGKRTQDLAALVGPTIANVLEHEGVRPSETSDWVGMRVDTTVTVEGREYTVGITLTDVAAKAARTPAFTQAKADAKEAKLSAEDTKAYVKLALAQHDAPAEEPKVSLVKESA